MKVERTSAAQSLMRRKKRATSTRSGRQKELLFWLAALFLVIFVVACCAVTRRADDASSAAPRFEKSEIAPGGDVPRLSSPYCLHGCPQSTQGADGEVLHREGFLLSNNARTKFADWAAYRITRSTIGKSHRRKWAPDPDLHPEHTLEPEDYRGAHRALVVDRGHQVPLASFSGTRTPHQLNYMSNITPQRSALNRKLWNLLEQAERKLIFEGVAQDVFVVTGPLYEKEMAHLPGADEPHAVPSGYFKVIAVVRGADTSRADTSTAAFIVRQDMSGDESYCDHRVTIDEVEQRAWLDLFVALPEHIEAPLERSLGTLHSALGCP